MRQSLLLTSEYDFTQQTKAFIASVFATYLQIRIALQTNMFIANDERVLCWGRTLLALETNAFELEMNTLALETNALKTRARVSATRTQLATHTASYTHSNERIENARLNFSHTHTHTHS